MKRTIIWFSGGVPSAVAGKITLDKYPDAIPVFIDTHSEEKDLYRFLDDIQNWYGKEIIRLSSNKYTSVDDVVTKTKYMSGIAGARCTLELKKKVRFAFQQVDDIHVFGYTIDNRDFRRAIRFVENNFELILYFPLVNKGYTKKDCFNVIEEVGITIPYMYRINYDNNNCPGCLKVTSPWYCDKIRTDFPDIFNTRSEQGRRLNVRLVIYKGKRIFLDELPAGITFKKQKSESCDFLCGKG